MTSGGLPATGSVTLDGDLVLVGCGNGDFVFAAPDPKGTVMALDRASGSVRWSVAMPDAVLREMQAALMQVEGVAGVFYDLTHKPPGTIEWE